MIFFLSLHRFRSAEEAERWRTLLQAWKDYAFDYGTYYDPLILLLLDDWLYYQLSILFYSYLILLSYVALDSQGMINDDLSSFDHYDVESIRESLETNAANKRAASAASESKRAADPFDLDSIVVRIIYTLSFIY